MCQNQILFFQSPHQKYHRSFDSTIGTSRFSRSDSCQHFLEPESDLNSDLCRGFGRHIQDAEHVQSLGRWYFCTCEGKCHQKSTIIWNLKDKLSLYYPFLHYIVQCEIKTATSYNSPSITQSLHLSILKIRNCLFIPLPQESLLHSRSLYPPGPRTPGLGKVCVQTSTCCCQPHSNHGTAGSKILGSDMIDLSSE